MKIFYAVQATGNGHISRATELMPYLTKLGKVDVFLSGANASLQAPFDVKFRSKGLSLFYSQCGGLDYKTIWQKNSWYRAIREAKQLPVEQYDVVINDFDFITSQACKLKSVPSVHFGHQASFNSLHTPRPAKRSKIGELILQRYATGTTNVGLHFQPYDSFILPPVIKQQIIQANPSRKGYFTVYLPAYQQHCLEKHFKALPQVHFQWFLHGIKQPHTIGNITYFPINNAMFTKSLIDCDGIITGGGFETPAEALYLNKHLMCIPIRAQYEQQCNGAALKQMGITVLDEADTEHFHLDIETWLNKPMAQVSMQANNIPDTLQLVLQTGSQNSPQFNYSAAAPAMPEPHLHY